MSVLNSSSLVLTLCLLTFIFSIHNTSGSETEIKKCPLSAANCLFRDQWDNRLNCCEQPIGPKPISCEYCTGKDLCERVRQVVEISDREMQYERYDLDGIIRYCCEKYGVCLVHKYSIKIFWCLNAQECNHSIRYDIRKACCKREIGCDIPLEVPDPDSLLDEPCLKLKKGACMDSENYERCCSGYGIGCDADVCPQEGEFETWMYTQVPRCCFDKSPCLHPGQWGTCCETYNKCNKKICDPMYDNVTTRVSVFDEVNQQQGKKLEYRVPEIRGYGRVRDG